MTKAEAEMFKDRLELADGVSLCKELMSHGRSVEEVLAFLRHSDYTIIQSIRILHYVLDIPVEDAKELVHTSRAWADRREMHNTFHATLWEAAEELSRQQSGSD